MLWSSFQLETHKFNLKKPILTSRAMISSSLIEITLSTQSQSSWFFRGGGCYSSTGALSGKSRLMCFLAVAIVMAMATVLWSNYRADGGPDWAGPQNPLDKERTQTMAGPRGRRARRRTPTVGRGGGGPRHPDSHSHTCAMSIMCRFLFVIFLGDWAINFSTVVNFLVCRNRCDTHLIRQFITLDWI